MQSVALFQSKNITSPQIAFQQKDTLFQHQLKIFFLSNSKEPNSCNAGKQMQALRGSVVYIWMETFIPKWGSRTKARVSPTWFVFVFLFLFVFDLLFIYLFFFFNRRVLPSEVNASVNIFLLSVSGVISFLMILFSAWVVNTAYVFTCVSNQCSHMSSSQGCR